MNKLLGKVAAGILVIALIIAGSYLFGADVKEVYAASSNAFHTESLEVSKYIDGEGNRTAPKPTASGYEDWIFAGWYRDAECTKAVNSTSGTRCAKFVPSEVLSVKCQVTKGTTQETTQTSSLRLISTVDSLNYSEVGFEVSFDFGAEKLEIPTNKVFKRIVSSTEGQDYGYSPNIFDLQSEYFVTATLTNIDKENFDDSFYIRPYWKTLDGTKVYGVSRCVRVEDSYLNIVNVPVRLYSDASVTGGSVAVAYNATNFTFYGYDDPSDLGNVTVDSSTSGTVNISKNGDAAIVADGMFVNLRLQRQVAESSLPKKNSFSVTSNLTVADNETVVVPNVIHTHYHTEYNGTPDIEWWNNKVSGQTKFVITSPAELYGVASLTASGTGFSNYTIYLGADINVNNGTVNEWKTTVPTHKWVNTIGNSAKANFNGTFDGQGNTISGIYMNVAVENAGLFGVTSKVSTIKNLKLTNSYFKSTAGRLGSIAGIGGGKIESVYSEATVESSASYTGGLVGLINNGENTGKNQFVNCCFAGTVSGTDYVGGILGAMGWNGVQIKVIMNNCLSKGNVTGSKNNVGGFCGAVLCINNNVNTIDMSDCLNSSVVRVGTGLTACNSSIIGRAHGTSIVNLTDIYTTDDVKTSDGLNVANQVIGVGSASGSAVFGGEDKKAQIIDASAITGFNTVDKVPDLDYTNYWVAKVSGAPELKSFVKANALCEADTDWYYDNPSASEFTIYTKEELYGFSKLINNKVTNFLGKKVILGADIIVNTGNAKSWGTTQPAYSWIPIGNSSYNFNGSFDGNGHTISGIYCAGSANVGLFGVTTSNSVIRNFELENSYFYNSGQCTGSIAGLGSGKFEKIYVHNNVLVDAADMITGGIVGRVNTKNDKNLIAECWFDGTIKATKEFTGGIVANVFNGSLTIENCLYSGTITSISIQVGGICFGASVNNNTASLSIKDCVSVGDITASNYARVGSVLGCMYADATVEISNTYASTKANYGTYTYSGGDQTNIKPKTVNLTGTQARYNTALDIYSSQTENAIWVARKGKAPALKIFIPEKEWYTADETIVADTTWYNASSSSFTIMTEAEFYGFSKLLSDKTANFVGGKVVYLGADILINQGDAKTWGAKAPINAWIPIGHSGMNFNGSFDGNGHTISGLYSSGTESVGLFGVTTYNSVIRNFELENSYFYNSGNYTGAIAGIAGGKIEKAYVHNDVLIDTAGMITGGIVGRVNSKSDKNLITECWFDGAINTTKEYAGGIVANVFNGSLTIQNCLYSGTITSTSVQVGGICFGATVNNNTASLTIKDCVSVGDITASNYARVGSVLGCMYANATVEVSNTYASTKANYGTYTYSGGDQTNIKPKTVNLLGAQARYNTALDFYLNEMNDGIWVAREGKTPALKCFVPESEWYTADETIVPDTSWHDKNPASTSFTIMTAAELYGLSYIVANSTTTFANDTIYLEADIIVNNGVAENWESLQAVNSWTPIGRSGYGFCGHFDGQNHTISGLYTKTSNSYVGLFGFTTNNSAIKNVRLVNSYFEQSAANAEYLGSILGNGDTGSISGVYSDAILVSAGSYIGGIIGRVGGGSSYPTYTLNNCWYEGTIISPKQYLGGVLGVINQAKINMENCLFTGVIESAYSDSATGARIGGLCAYPMNDSIVNISDSISAGRIIDNCNGHTVGSVVGRISSGNSDVNISNVFATIECCASAFGSVDSGNSNIKDILGTVVRVKETDRLIGFCTEKTGEVLDFDNDWVMRTSGVPVLKYFGDIVSNKVVADSATLNATLTAELGLDMSIFGTQTLKDAINYGLGNYQISVSGITLEQYNGESGYLTKLESLGFELYVTNADSTMDDDGVYNAIYTKKSGDWVINATYSSNTKELNVHISTGGSKSLSKNLKAENVVTDGTKDITLSMLQLSSAKGTSSDGIYSYYYGNSFVVQLPDGHFIINDGGDDADFDGLISYLESLTGEDAEIYIDAWTVSHQHSDHFDVIKGFIDSDKASKIHVEAFYINEPNRKSWSSEGDTTLSTTFEKQYQGIYSLTKADGKTTPDIFWYQTGQRYYFNGITMDVIQSQEQLEFENYGQNALVENPSMNDYNATSTMLLFTTSNGEKVLIGGDANYKNMELVIDLYGDKPTKTLNDINVYTAFHHGKNTSYTLENSNNINVFTDYLLKGTKKVFDVVLFPCSDVFNSNYTSAFPGAVEANKYLQEKSTYDYHYGNGTVVIILNGNDVTQTDISVISNQ